MEFTNNSASLKGAAIFLNSLVGCLWGEDDDNRQHNRSLRWADKITYTGNFILLEGNSVKIEGPKVDIATDTYDYIVTNSHKSLQVSSILYSPLFCSIDVRMYINNLQTNNLLYNST